MKATLLSRAALLGGGLSLMLGCSEPSSPLSALLDPPPLPTGVLTCTPLPYDSVTATIGAARPI